MYLGIFLISAATLLFEISLTRVFSVLFFHHFVFLVISTALFGFGFSGVFLFFFQKKIRNLKNSLSLGALLFAITIVVCYWVILQMPHRFQDISENPRYIARLILNYGILIIPFFFSGCVIGLILSTFTEKSGRLYCADLIGASLGCISVLWLVPAIGASGAIAAASLLAASSSLSFWPSSKALKASVVLVAAGALYLLPQAETRLPLPMSEIFREKHGNFFQAPSRKIEFSAWSPVSRLDVIATAPSKLIYLDGGSNVSFLVPFGGDPENMKPRLNARTVPYSIAPRKSACIIGPGGGEDVLNALSFGVPRIVAIEMDPLMVKIVQGKYNELIGRIFQLPPVQLINDEGRSFLRRSKEQFDIIQTVHNCSPMALATGAFNLSESYLFTKEAFHEYWQRLNPGGMLAINRGGILRAAPIASVVLQENGIADPENSVIVITKKFGDTGFYLKKGRITESDLANLQDAQKISKTYTVYAPTPEFQTPQNVYYQLLKPSLRDALIRRADIVLEPPTDNWPFFDHYQRLGSFQTKTSILPEELNQAIAFHNMGDLALFALLGEAALLSFVFIVLPLFRLKKIQSGRSTVPILLYFSAIGAGFILIEISLFQKHILFMGQPVYSITSVLFSLLISAGLGSLIFQYLFREGREKSWLLTIFGILSGLVLVEMFITPHVLNAFLGLSMIQRFVISGLTIAPLGFIMGMPFPFALRVIGKRFPEAIPWGWGLNAYMTVVGSILCVIFALTIGFRMNFLIALAIYCTGFVSLYTMLRRS
jgi:predicted membrane-bound spermidine synthase